MTSDPKLDAYLTQLAASHKFTLEQLAANRAGRIHPEQLARRRRSGIRWVIVLIVLSVLVGVAGVAGAIMAYDLPPPPSGVDRTGFFQLAGGGLVVAAALLIAARVPDEDHRASHDFRSDSDRTFVLVHRQLLYCTNRRTVQLAEGARLTFSLPSSIAHDPILHHPIDSSNRITSHSESIRNNPRRSGPR